MKFKYIFIDSTNRLDSVDDDPANYKIKLNEDIDAQALELLKVQIPNTFYNITRRNNYLFIDGNRREIQAGNYSLQELLNQLTNDIAEISGITFDDIIGEVVITLTGSLSLNFGDSFMYQILGFTRGYNQTSTNHTSIRGPAIYDLELFLTISGADSGFASSSSHHNSTFIVPNNTNKNDLIVYYQNTQYEQCVTYTSSNKNNRILNIKWKNQYGDLFENLCEHTMILKAFIYD